MRGLVRSLFTIEGIFAYMKARADERPCSRSRGQRPSDKFASIIGFPDMENLEAAFASDAYQAMVPLRNPAADATIVEFEQLV